MDDPPFYRDDLQAYYDLRISAGDEGPTAMSKTKRQFKVKTLIVTPTGEVRSPGIVDNPDQPPPPTAPPEGEEPPPEEPTDDESPGSQMGSEDPHGKDGGKGAEESLDEVWLGFLDGDDALELFESVTDDPALAAWEAPDLEEHWRPAHLPKRVLSGSDEELSRDSAQLYEKFQRLVNMRSGEMRAHLRSSALREAIATTRRSKRGPLTDGMKAARYVLRMKATPLSEWTDETWARCRKVVTFIERTRRNSTPLIDEEGCASRKLIALRTWGHNPTVRATVTEAEVEPLLEHPRALHRYLDATPGIGPVALLDEAEKVRAPAMDVLKKYKVRMSDEERSEVMDREAVWHHGPNGEETPAVWKAEVRGSTWFVTNTHRAYQARPSLAGAISAYHRGIKQTA